MVSLFFRYVAPALHCISSESEIHPPLKSKSFDISLHFTSFLKRITDAGVNLFLGGASSETCEGRSGVDISDVPEPIQQSGSRSNGFSFLLNLVIHGQVVNVHEGD